MRASIVGGIIAVAAIMTYFDVEDVGKLETARATIKNVYNKNVVIPVTVEGYSITEQEQEKILEKYGPLINQDIKDDKAAEMDKQAGVIHQKAQQLRSSGPTTMPG